MILSDKLSCLKEETNQPEWKRLQPSELPAKDILQPVELPAAVQHTPGFQLLLAVTHAGDMTVFESFLIL